MFYKPGEVIILKANCRLASGRIMEDFFPEHVGKSAIISLVQMERSQSSGQYYCHYKVKLLDDVENNIPFNYFKVVHDDGVEIDLGYIRNETLKKIGI